MHICLEGVVRVELTMPCGARFKVWWGYQFSYTPIVFGAPNGIRTHLVFYHRQIESLMTRQLVVRSDVTVKLELLELDELCCDTFYGYYLQELLLVEL